MAVAADIINQHYAEKSSGTYGVGGALTFAPPEVSLIKDSSFTNNRSLIGGAVVSRGHITSVSNSIFQGNTSETGGGGAIYSQMRFPVTKMSIPAELIKSATFSF